MIIYKWVIYWSYRGWININVIACPMESQSSILSASSLLQYINSIYNKPPYINADNDASVFFPSWTDYAAE